jgi:excisionase family DNA binding protein
MTTEPTQYISLQDAADRLAVDPKTVRRYISRGLLPAVKLGGHLVRIPVAAINNLGRPVAGPADH